MIRVVFAIFLLIFFSLILQKVFADDSLETQKELQRLQEDNKILHKTLTQQREMIETLRQQKSAEEIRRITEEIITEREEEKRLKNLFSEGGLENMIFHGYVDLEWKSTAFDRAQGGTRGHNFFDNHHFNLWFGYRITDDLIAKSEIEIEHAGETFGVEFATLGWKPFSSDLLEILMGIILVPLGVENPVHASVRNKLISRPLPSLSILPGTYGDVGIELRGLIPLSPDVKVRYHLYIVNGLGDDDGDLIYEQDALKRGRDNNGNKAVGTQIAISPIPELEGGVSAYFGKWDDQDKNTTFILGTHFIYDLAPVEIRAEYLFQEIADANGPDSGNAVLQGFYVQGAFRFSGLRPNSVLNRFELVTRYDWVKNEDGVIGLKQGDIPSGKSEGRIAVGLIFRPLEQLQFKLEALSRDNKNRADDQGLAFQAVANW